MSNVFVGSEIYRNFKIRCAKRISSLIVGAQDIEVVGVVIAAWQVFLFWSATFANTLYRHDLVPAIWQRQILQGVLAYPPMTHVVSTDASQMYARQGTCN